MVLPATSPLFQAALGILRATPGYARVALELAQLADEGRIHLDANLEDRAHAGLLGALTLGPEATGGSSLSLAQTLVHEHFHLRQNPLLKTLSFWIGVVQGAPVMQRYERPAYLAAHDFLEAVKLEAVKLEAVKRAHPGLVAEAEAEQSAISQVFATTFGAVLR